MCTWTSGSACVSSGSPRASDYRVILPKPKGPGRFPSVFLIGGLGCYSLDNLPTDHPYRHILYDLTKKGFVTMRVDKNGEGDSEGPPCDNPQSDLHLAVERSVAGLHSQKWQNWSFPFTLEAQLKLGW